MKIRITVYAENTGPLWGQVVRKDVVRLLKDRRKHKVDIPTGAGSVEVELIEDDQ